ncbi:MAG: hypothetical protein M3332_11330 [Actinomycetota bacterium]|nr:hypothetical protein [Actinomycetota bacterium]
MQYIARDRDRAEAFYGERHPHTPIVTAADSSDCSGIELVDGSRTLLLSFVWALALPGSETGLNRKLLRPLDVQLSNAWKSVDRFHSTDEHRANRWQVQTSDAGYPVRITSGARRVSARFFAGEYPRRSALSLILSVNLGPLTMSTKTGESVDPLAVDHAIAVLHSLDKGRASPEVAGSPIQVHDGNGVRYSSVKAAAIATLERLVGSANLIDRLQRCGWCFEVRGFDGCSPADMVDADARPFFGLLRGDEGWRFVAPDQAHRDLGEPLWRSRRFIAVYNHVGGVLSFNNKSDAYITSQHELSCEWFGEPEPYFGLSTDVAGLDHGPLLVLERVLTRLAVADYRLREAENSIGVLERTRSNAIRPSTISKAAASNRTLRRALNDSAEYLRSVLRHGVELERAMSDSLQLRDTVEQLDRTAQAVDEETREHYELRVSNLVAMLTAITVLLTVVTIVVGVLQITLR